ncbi:MAG: ATPase domain-containing protein [Candidatus Bathyarchaeia archaeon]
MGLSGKENSGSSIEDLSRKLDQVLQRLDLIERSILGKPEYEGLATALQLTRLGIGMYGEPLKIAARLKSAENYLRQTMIAQDEISRCIIQALALKGPLNISAITRQTAAMRGKASRRIVRSRLEKLVKQGVIVRMDGRIPTYNLVEKGISTPSTRPDQTMTSEALPDRVTTGNSDLDSLLLGGLPQNYAVLLTSPSCDERDLLVERFLEAGLKEDQIVFFVTAKATGLPNLAEQYPSNFYLFVCNPQANSIIESLPNVFKVAGIDNLTDVNIALTSAFRKLNASPRGQRRIVLEIVSDVLLQHHAVQTRRWLSALIPELKSKAFTTFAVIDREMHSPQEVRAIQDLFEGEINLWEKESADGLTRYLRVRKMHNQRYSEEELLLRKERLKS